MPQETHKDYGLTKFVPLFIIMVEPSKLYPSFQKLAGHVLIRK